MAKDFDPYHKWLGIPPQEQPPNHYRLLALDVLESDPEVIDAAANRQMAYLQQRATGEHAALSQKLLNELSAVRLCLLDPKKKAAYDAELKARQSTASKETTSSQPGSVQPDPLAFLHPTNSTEDQSTSGKLPVPKHKPSETAVPLDDSAPQATPALRPSLPISHSRLSPKIIIGSGLAVVLILILWFAFSGGKKKEVTVAQVLPSGNQSAPALGQKDHAIASDEKKPAETHDASPSLPEPKTESSTISVVRPLEQSRPQAPTTAKPPELVEVAELNPGTYAWLSPDGLTVFWEKDKTAIWTAHRENPEAHFSGQKELLAGRQPTVTADGLRMVLVARSSGGPNEESLYTTERTSIDEPFRRSTEISELVDQPKATQPCLSGDGLTLYFTVGSVADYHLMVTSRQSLSAPWSTPLPVPCTNPTEEPLNWCFVLDDRLSMFCFGGHGWKTNLSYWRRPSVQQPFVKLSNLSVDGVPLVGRCPRYIAATSELFFTRFLGAKQFAIWVVKNFVPPVESPTLPSQAENRNPEPDLRGSSDWRLFVGEWRVGHPRGPDFIISLYRDFTAWNSMLKSGGGKGKWEYVNGEVRITWGSSAWRNTIRREGQGFRKLTFGPGKSFDDPPTSIDAAVKIPSGSISDPTNNTTISPSAAASSTKGSGSLSQAPTASDSVSPASVAASRKPAYPDDAVAFGGHHYKVIWEQLSWTEAKEACARMGGRLACIERDEEKTFLADLKGTGKVVWVGAHRVDSNTWEWLNGKPLEPRELKGHGRDSGSDYVAFHVGSGLNARPLNGYVKKNPVRDIQGYICEWGK